MIDRSQQQKTLRAAVHSSGVGLHSGEYARITLCPAPEDTGLVFRRVDRDPVVEIPVRPEFVHDTRFAVTLARGRVTVRTVEHLLAALSELGVDNCYVDLDADEVPIKDGSAEPYVRMIESAGIRVQGKPCEVLSIPHPIWITEGDDKYLIVLPSDTFKVSYGIDFNHPDLRGQYAHFEITPEIFRREIASARTFGFLEEVEALRKNGYAKGGSVDNAVVYHENGVLTPLRFKNEAVRHKILDLLGDLALLGQRVRGHVIARKSGHTLDARLVGEIARIMSANQFQRPSDRQISAVNRKFEAVRRKYRLS